MRKRVVVATVSVVLAGALPALAATPKSGRFTSGGEGGSGFTVRSGRIVKGATVPSNFKCNRVNAVIPVSVPIRSGRARYRGALKGQAGRIVVTVTFTSATRATVATSITRGACRSGTVRAKVALQRAMSVG
jgi:hypothetical protein